MDTIAFKGVLSANGNHIGEFEFSVTIGENDWFGNFSSDDPAIFDGLKLRVRSLEPIVDDETHFDGAIVLTNMDASSDNVSYFFQFQGSGPPFISD